MNLYVKSKTTTTIKQAPENRWVVRGRGWEVREIVNVLFSFWGFFFSLNELKIFILKIVFESIKVNSLPIIVTVLLPPHLDLC